MFKVYTSRKQFDRECPFTLEPNAISAIHRSGEFRFTASGRRYSMTVGGEGIGHLMNAEGCPDFQECPQICEQLQVIAGAIVICNEGDQGDGEFLPFSDSNELINAWRELAEISGVQISDADQDILDIYRDEEDED